MIDWIVVVKALYLFALAILFKNYELLFFGLKGKHGQIGQEQASTVALHVKLSVIVMSSCICHLRRFHW